MLGLSPCNETNWEEKEGKKRAGVHAARQGFFGFGVWSTAYNETERGREREGERGGEERSLGFSGPRQGKKVSS